VHYKLEGEWSRTFATVMTSSCWPQEFVDRLDRVSCEYSLLINVDNTKVMACRILIQNELLEQVDTFPYLGSLITEDGDWSVYDGIPYQVKQRAGDRGITAEKKEKSQHTDFNEDTSDESASVACSKIRL